MGKTYSLNKKLIKPNITHARAWWGWIKGKNQESKVLRNYFDKIRCDTELHVSIIENNHDFSSFNEDILKEIWELEGQPIVGVIQISQ
jgi:hypothetical protein